MNKSTGWLFGAVLLSICAVLQLIALFRYYSRLPEDTIGIALYSASLIFFIIAAFGFYINWKKHKEIK